MTQETAAKKDTQKLQRAIVDGLEDVKAQDIQVFNTEHLSPLFERVIVASGTSNRQTKALAASVRDAVREAGFPKPRIEGEDNGEWIIVDCGAAVAHIMQPAIRQYYHLEEIWGDKPVRLKFGAPKPVPQRRAPEPAAKAPAKKARPSRRAGRAAAAARPRRAREGRRARPAQGGGQGAGRKKARAKPRQRKPPPRSRRPQGAPAAGKTRRAARRRPSQRQVAAQAVRRQGRRQERAAKKTARKAASRKA